MAKSSTWITAIIIALICFLAIWFIKDSYVLLPRIPKPGSDMAVSKTDLFSTWVEFSPPSQAFQVKLPAVPQHATDVLVDPKTKEKRKYDMYVSEKSNGTIFMISMITFPTTPPPAEVDGLLKSLINNMVIANPQNNLADINPTQFLGLTAMNFKIENKSADLDVEGKIFMHSNVIYLLTVINSGSIPLDGEKDYFINSFQLTAPSSGYVPFPPER